MNINKRAICIAKHHFGLTGDYDVKYNRFWPDDPKIPAIPAHPDYVYFPHDTNFDFADSGEANKPYLTL